MIDQPNASPFRQFPFVMAAVLTAAIIACSVYANLSFAVTRPRGPTGATSPFTWTATPTPGCSWLGRP
jgi:hypothetical protein